MSVKNPIKCEDGRHIPFEVGDTLPADTLNLAELILGSDGIDIIDNGDGTVTVVNLCCEEPSMHTVIGVVANMPSITEGGVASWTVTVDAPVTVDPLYILFALSGTEQVDNNYPNPSLVIPVGQSFGIVTVPTTVDVGAEATKPLCLAALVGYRVTAVPAAVCIDVLDETGTEDNASIAYTNLTAGAINEGLTAILRVTLNGPAGVGGVSGTVDFSGSEKIAHPADYPDIPFTVLSGNSFIDINVPITSGDGADPNTALVATMSGLTVGWDIFDGTDTAIVLNTAGGGSGGCYAAGTLLRYKDGYKVIDGLLVGGFLSGFSLPGMVDESNPNWYTWKTGSLKDLAIIDTRVRSNQPFTATEGYSINGGPMTTGDHRHFAKKGTKFGWHQAKDIGVGYSMVSSEGKLVPVTTNEKIEGLFTFYTLDVENNDTLIAKFPEGDLLGHNRKCADCPDGPF